VKDQIETKKTSYCKDGSKENLQKEFQLLLLLTTKYVFSVITQAESANSKYFSSFLFFYSLFHKLSGELLFILNGCLLKIKDLCTVL